MDKLRSAIDQPSKFSTDLDKAVLCPLDHLSCYEISGKDAKDFLQGQLTNDIAQISSTQAQLSSYCTPKGRMLAIFYICQWQDKYLILLRKDIAESVIKRLQMFVLRSKVEINQLPSLEQSIVGLSGEDLSHHINTLNLQLPANDYEVFNTKHSLCIKIPGVIPRYILLGDDTFSESTNSLDQNNLYVFTKNYWQWLDVMSGIPTVTELTQEAFVPQMTNMELINGVSFSKGCYPGQEVVARLHYLGNASRRMYRIETTSSSEINSGDDIYSIDGKSNQSIGNIVSAIKQGTNEYVGLAVLRIEAAQQNQLAVGAPTGAITTVKSLPYEIPTTKKE